MDNNDTNRTYYVVLLLIILILLYLLIRNFGYIENGPFFTPANNADIFEIEFNCCGDDDKAVFKEVSKNNTNKNELEQNNNDEPEENIEKIKDIFVSDDYKIWDNKELKIFSNPQYEYKNIVAPASYNSYAFVIRNNNDFDVVVDIMFEETNTKNINMNYKLKSNGIYLIGAENRYDTLKNKRINGIILSAKSQNSYVLDWKWIDSENDTQIGIDSNSIYKLSIQIGVNQKQ